MVCMYACMYYLSMYVCLSVSELVMAYFYSHGWIRGHMYACICVCLYLKCYPYCECDGEISRASFAAVAASLNLRTECIIHVDDDTSLAPKRTVTLEFSHVKRTCDWVDILALLSTSESGL
mgnify:CR=1 FL=1